MGIGKSFSGMGVSDLYHPQLWVFARRIAHIFKINIHVSICYLDFRNKLEGPEDFFPLDFGYEEHGYLLVYYDAEENGPLAAKEGLKWYDLNFTGPKGDWHEFTFYASGLVTIGSVDFAANWGSFVANIRFGYFGKNYLSPAYDRAESRAKIQQERDAYWSVLQPLGIRSLILHTDYYYNFEDDLITPELTRRFHNMHELSDWIRTSDDMSVWELEPLLRANKQEDLPRAFLEAYDIQIAFLDSCL